MTSPSQDEPQVRWSELVAFVRQLSHDIRNHLNAAELQAAYLSELAQDAEIKNEVKRLREMVAEVSKALQSVTSKMSAITATRIRYRCADLVEDVKQRLESSTEKPHVQWQIDLGETAFEVDPQLLQEAFLEIFANAARHAQSGAGPMVAAARIDGQQFEFTLREPKKDFQEPTEKWGFEPLQKMTRGHYGLGLNRVRMIVELLGGGFTAEYDSRTSSLRSRIVLPLAKPASG